MTFRPVTEQLRISLTLFLQPSHIARSVSVAQNYQTASTEARYTRDMRWMRIRRAAPLLPWNRPVGALQVVNEVLAERQMRIASACGLQFEGECDAPEPQPGRLLWEADVDVSVATLRTFLKVAVQGGRLAMVERPRRQGDLIPEPEGPFFKGQPTRIFGIQWGSNDQPVVVPPLGFAVQVPLPRSGNTELFLTVRTAQTIRHWVHLLQANLAALLPTLFEKLLLRPHHLLWSWLRWPLRGGRWAAIGRGCKIHPTARLEGCIIGNNVRIGACSILRGCIIGDDVTIEDHVSVRSSVVGNRAHLANWCLLNFSVVGARSSVGHIGAQASVIGEESFLSTFATLEDFSFGGNVKVRDGQRLADSGSPFLGCALGDRVSLAAHVTLSPGRAIPNDVQLLPDPQQIVQRLPTDFGAGRYVVSEGGLKRLP